MTLAEFLNARLDEDEAQARDLIESEAASAVWDEPHSGVLLTGPPTHDDTWDGTHSIGDSRITRFIARHDPARVLREVEARRSIIRMYQDAVAEASSEVVEWMLAVVATECRVYSDHADYDPDWAT